LPLFLFLHLNAISQNTHLKGSPLGEGAAETVGISTLRLDQIDSMLKESVKSGQVPGVVALIARDGKIVYHEAHGAANEKGRPIKKDDIFRIDSQTKAITSTAVMIL